MKSAVLVDRWADRALKLVLALNVAFFLSFLAVLVGLSGKAHAAAQTCTGKDLIAEMAVSDPATLAKIKAQAAATANGDGRLWKVEKTGTPASYLFGTMHVTDPRVVTLPPEAAKAFEAAHTLVIETTDVLDQKAMMAEMAQHPELMMFTNGTTLEKLLTPEQLEVVKSGLAERGLPFAAFSRMQPWILSSMVALPACETARKEAGEPFLDIKLAGDAKAEGKEIDGLETAYDQLKAMASLPTKFHIDGLVETLKLGPKMDDIYETMIDLYVKGDIAMIMPMLRAVSPDKEDADGGYAAFEKTLIETRNVTMAARAKPILDKGDAFIAVGAEHLVGKKGLVALLREAGYTVTAVPM